MKREARVIMCKCTSREPFGIRVEKMDNDWWRTWAFEIPESAAKNEGYMDEKIQGSFRATYEYPGCPYCKADLFVVCGACGKITCYKGERMFRCSWCNNSGEVGPASETLSVHGNGY